MPTQRRPQLARLRRTAGFSQEALADRLGVHPGTVRAWETGRQGIYPRHRQPLAEALGETLKAIDDIFATDTLEVTNVDRRRFIATTAATSAILSVAGIPARATTPRTATRLGTTDVARWRAHVADLIALDDHLGGTTVYQRAVDRYSTLRSTMASVNATGDVRASLYGVAGRLAELAAWCAWDSGNQATAGCWWNEALTTAQLAGDRPTAVCVLAGMSYAASGGRKPGDALAAAQAAEREADPWAPPRLRSLLAARAAVAHATAGDVGQTGTGLARAEALLDGGARDDDEPWFDFWGPADLHHHAAQAYTTLERPALAEPQCVAAIESNPLGYPRNGALYRSHHAVVLADLGEPEHAAAVAAEALELAGDLGPGRVCDQLAEMRVRLVPHGTLPTVATYIDGYDTAMTV